MKEKPLISVVMPCFNEHRTIEEIVHRVLSVPFHVELIIVDDGSTDGARDLLERIQKDHANVVVLLQPHNRGKGAALRAGFAAAQGEVVLIQDADLEYDPKDFGIVLNPILSGDADVVFGSRFLSGPHRVLYFWHSVGNKFLTTLSNIVTDLNLTDMETCYKAFRRDLLQAIPLTEDRFGFEPEVTIRVSRMKGVRIYEVPISYRGRTYVEGKKIGLKDAFRALYVIGESVRKSSPPAHHEVGGADHDEHGRAPHSSATSTADPSAGISR